jgi:hypothetical protein
MSNERPAPRAVLATIGRIVNEHSGREIRVEEVEAAHGHADLRIAATRPNGSTQFIDVPGPLVGELALFVEAYQARRRRRLRERVGR